MQQYTDILSPQKRSERMRQIRSKNTRPELLVRKLVYGMGLRYRLHDPRLPGKPDLVFAGRRKILYVHGCFWHHHDDCGTWHMPKSRSDYWRDKLQRNRQRDQQHLERLRNDGWQVMVVWECELKDLALLRIRLHGFLLS